MRPNLFRTLFVLFTGLLVHTSFAQNNCKVDEMFAKNRSLLGDYQFIKNFPVETSKQVEKVQYTYVLNRDTKYRMVIVDSGVKGQRMKVTIRDSGRKLLTNNKDKQKPGFVNQLDFVCPATGIYYFEVTFENDHKDCGLNILGYQK
jgi:hypothetical protein